MDVQILDDHTLMSVAPSTISTYLRNRSWTQIGQWRDRATVYEWRDGGERWVVHVPVRDTFADYVDDTARTLGVLSEVENRSQLDIISDLRSAGADRIWIAALNASEIARLSLYDASYLMDDALKLLSSAARAAEKRRPAYRGPVSQSASRFLSDLSAAPTNFDSFEITMYSPVPALIGQAPLLAEVSEPPFSRRAVNALAVGLQATQTAIAGVTQSDDLSHFDRAVQHGVSANLCGAIAELIEHSHDFGSGVSVDVRWADVRPERGDRRKVIPFSTHQFDILNAARHHLRTKASFVDEHLLVDVVRLEREPEDFHGRAVLLADLDDRTYRIDVEFEKSDYQIALRAHDKKLALELDGDLQPAGRGYQMRNPRNLYLHDESIK